MPQGKETCLLISSISVAVINYKIFLFASVYFTFILKTLVENAGLLVYHWLRLFFPWNLNNQNKSS